MCNDIGSDGAEQIGIAMQVIEINFKFWFYYFLLIFFINYYQKNETIVYLNLNGNKIGNKGGMSMAQMLQVNNVLQHLDLGETDMVQMIF